MTVPALESSLLFTSNSIKQPFRGKHVSRAQAHTSPLSDQRMKLSCFCTKLGFIPLVQATPSRIVDGPQLKEVGNQMKVNRVKATEMLIPQWKSLSYGEGIKEEAEISFLFSGLENRIGDLVKSLYTFTELSYLSSEIDSVKKTVIMPKIFALIMTTFFIFLQERVLLRSLMFLHRGSLSTFL